MKIGSIFAIILAIILGIGISSCSKSPESKVKDYLTKLSEWYDSEDFQNTIKAGLANNQQDIMKIIKDKQNKILEEAGFASEEEFQQELAKINNDPKIMELSLKVAAASMRALEPYMQKFKEEMNKALDTTAEAIEKANEELEKTIEENQAK